MQLVRSFLKSSSRHGDLLGKSESIVWKIGLHPVEMSGPKEIVDAARNSLQSLQGFDEGKPCAL